MFCLLLGGCYNRNLIAYLESLSHQGDIVKRDMLCCVPDLIVLLETSSETIVDKDNWIAAEHVAT